MLCAISFLVEGEDARTVLRLQSDGRTGAIQATGAA